MILFQSCSHQEIIMKNKLFILSFILFFFLPVALPAQNSNKLWIEVNSGFTYAGLNQSFLANWGDGWNIGTGVTYRFTPQIELGTRLSYQRLGFQGDKLEFVSPAFVGTSTLRVNGKPTSIYEVSTTLRLIVPAPYIKPFFSVGGGIYFMSVGKITYWQSGLSDISALLLYEGSGKMYKRAFGSLGIGFEAPVSKKIQLRLEGQYVNIFKNFGPFVPVNAAFQVAL